MSSLVSRWRNASIAKKLYFVFGIMALLIAAELFTLRFSMRHLSAVRAFVGGESLWSKAQKDAVFSLQRYAVTGLEADYQTYLKLLEVPEGDHQARLEIIKPDFNHQVAAAGFIAGKIHPDDVDGIIVLLRQFYWVSYLDRAIKTWGEADALLFQLKRAGSELHRAIQSGELEKTSLILTEIKNLNDQLTVQEEKFSAVLGEGSRWLENAILTFLLMAVLIVEITGLSITFFTSRGILRGLADLRSVAEQIGHGDFSKTVQIRSLDEIGLVGQSINSMGSLLQKSYDDLEQRVKDRTAELDLAVETRDEFLSIASHELKMPLAGLYLQLQRLDSELENVDENLDYKRLRMLSQNSLSSTGRTIKLLNSLLDLTRMQIGRFELHREDNDVVTIVNEVVNQFRLEAERAGCELKVAGDLVVRAKVDRLRMTQVATNLISNAIRYGKGKPVDVKIQQRGDQIVLEVCDHGKGIAKERMARLFEKYQRDHDSQNVAGLGLGLYISSQIVKAHDGLLQVQSDLGRGSVFTVTI